MSFLMSLITSVSASPIFVSAPVQSIITALGLSAATVTIQVVVLAVLSIIAVMAIVSFSYMLVKGLMNLKQNEEEEEEEQELGLKPEALKDAGVKSTSKSKKPQSLEDRKSAAIADMATYINLISNEIGCITKSKIIVDKEYESYCDNLINEILGIKNQIDFFNLNWGYEAFEELQVQKKQIDIKMKVFLKKQAAAKTESAGEKKARLQQKIMKLEKKLVKHQASLNTAPADPDEKLAMEQSIKNLDVQIEKLTKECSQIVDVFFDKGMEAPVVVKKEVPLKICFKNGVKYQIIEDERDANSDDGYSSDDESLRRYRKIG